jgi:Leucine carboxyl methyltransferase
MLRRWCSADEGLLVPCGLFLAGSSGAARTRLIDDWVREALAAGVRQVVILGQVSIVAPCGWGSWRIFPFSKWIAQLLALEASIIIFRARINGGAHFAVFEYFLRSLELGRGD